MGFSTVGATAVLVIAAFHVGGTSLPQVLDVDEQMDAAEARSWDRALLRQTADATISSASNSGGNVTIDATNQGDATLDARQLLVLLDGEPSTPDEWTVDGQPSSIWAPGQEISLTIAGASASNIALVLETGTMVFGAI